MTQESIRVHTSDVRTLLNFVLKQADTAGDLQVVDLTGLATPKFKMFNIHDYQQNL